MRGHNGQEGVASLDSVEGPVSSGGTATMLGTEAPDGARPPFTGAEAQIPTWLSRAGGWTVGSASAPGSQGASQALGTWQHVWAPETRACGASSPGRPAGSDVQSALLYPTARPSPPLCLWEPRPLQGAGSRCVPTAIPIHARGWCGSGYSPYSGGWWPFAPRCPMQCGLD